MIVTIDWSQAGVLMAATALQLAVAVAAYLFGRAGGRQAWARTPQVLVPSAQVPVSPGQLAERMRLLFRFAPDALLLCDSGGVVLDVNEYLTELSGYSLEELLGRSLAALALLPSGEQKRAFTEFAHLAAGQLSEMRPVEFVIRRKNGTAVPVEVRGDLIP